MRERRRPRNRDPRTARPRCNRTSPQPVRAPRASDTHRRCSHSRTPSTMLAFTNTRSAGARPSATSIKACMSLTRSVSISTAPALRARSHFTHGTHARPIETHKRTRPADCRPDPVTGSPPAIGSHPSSQPKTNGRISQKKANRAIGSHPSSQPKTNGRISQKKANRETDRPFECAICTRPLLHRAELRPGGRTCACRPAEPCRV